MLRVTMHPLADITQIGKESLFRSFSRDGGWDEGEFLLVSGEFGIVGVEQRVEAAKELCGRVKSRSQR